MSSIELLVQRPNVSLNVCHRHLHLQSFVQSAYEKESYSWVAAMVS